jgi:hypothetical protein
MNKLLVALFGLALISMALTTGCSTITESPAERAHNIGQVVQYHQLQFNEDLDDFLLEDRPSRLTYWIIR